MILEASARFKSILEFAVYYTVIDGIKTNVTERVFASRREPVRKKVKAEDFDRFVNKTIIPKVNEWKVEHPYNFLCLSLKNTNYSNKVEKCEDGIGRRFSVRLLGVIYGSRARLNVRMCDSGGGKLIQPRKMSL